MREKVKHIFFDLDHTLWDFHTNSAMAFKKLLAEENLPVSYERFMEIYRPVNLKVWKDYTAGKYTKEQVKIIRLKYTLDQLEIILPPDEILRMAERYLSLLAEGTVLFPGAIETLEYLMEKYSLHLLTNGFAEVQYRKIEISGLKPYFRSITLSEETGQLKPHPHVFQYALHKAGAFPHESLMIGDNVQADILGALNVGMKAIIFDPDNVTNFPEVIASKIRHLTQLKNLL